MSSRKVADAHVQFTTKGLDAVKGDMDSLKADLKRLEAGRERLNITPKFDARLSNIMELQRNLRVAIALNRELNRQSAGKDVRRASNVIQAGISADRRNEQRLASGRAHTNIANRRDDALVASPALRRATQTAVKESLTALKSDRDSIAKTIANSSTLSPAFKAKTAGVSHLNIQPSASSFQMRNEAQRIRDMVDSVKLFGRAGTKTAAEVNDFREDMEKLARSLEQAAKQADDLTAAQAKAKSLGVQGQGALRGSIRDEAMAKERVSAVLGRQEGREFQKMSPREALDRRAVEIGNLKGQMNTFDRNQEVAMATEAIASSMRDLAQQIRESPIDNALTELANKFRSGAISEKDFRLGVMSRQAQRRGYEAAQVKIENAAFSAEHGGASQDTYAKSGEVNALTERKDAIDKLLVATGKMTAAEKEKLETERETIEAEIKHVKSQEEIATLIDKEEAALKKLITAKNAFIAKRAKGVALTKEEIREERQLDKQINESAKRMNTYTNAVYGGNVALNKAANSSRNFNFKMQQLSYGVQDFVQVIGQTGLAGALRASANNMASFFAASGTVGGAIAGGLGTVLMIGIADVIQRIGNNADEAESKIDRFAAALERASKIRVQAQDFGGKLVEEALGTGKHSSRPGIEARERAFNTAKEAGGIGDSILSAVNKAADERTEKEAGRGIANATLFGSNPQALAAMKLSGESDVDIKKEAEKLLQYTYYTETRRINDPSDRYTEARGADKPTRESIKKKLSEKKDSFRESQALKEILRIEQQVNDVLNSKISDISGVGALGGIIGGVEGLPEKIKEYKDAISNQEIAIEQSEQSLIRLGKSLDQLESDISSQSAFSDSSAKIAVEAVAEELFESSSRLRVANDALTGMHGQAADLQRKLIEAEQKHYDRHLQTLDNLNNGLKSSTNPTTGISGRLSAIAASMVSGRVKFEKSLEFVDPAKRASMLADYDKSVAKSSSELMKVEVLGFSGNAERMLGETQDQANGRQRTFLQSLIDTLSGNANPEDDVLIPIVEMAKRKVGTSDKDAQSRTATTPIESLHQKIQDSLTGIDADFDLQKEQRDLLKRIAANTEKVAHPDTSADALRRRADEQIPTGGGSAVSTPPQPTPVPAGGGSGPAASTPPDELSDKEAAVLAAEAAYVAAGRVTDDLNDKYRNAAEDSPEQTALDTASDTEQKLLRRLEDSVAEFVNAGGSIARATELLGDRGITEYAVQEVLKDNNARKGISQADPSNESTPVPAGGGQMSVPPPQLQYDGTVLPGTQEKLSRTATNPEITGYKSAANHDAGLLEKMAAEGPIPMGNSDPDLYGMNRILDDAGKASASNVFNRGGRELSGHDNRSKKYKEIAARSAAARAGRMKPESISDEQIDANVTRKMRDEGYTELLQGTRSGAYKSSADSFYSARRAGAVSDFQRTGPKFVDDFPGARRGRGLTASQQQAIQRPEQQEFAPKVIPAGPQITRENVRDEINKLPSPDYGPQITWQNSMQAGPAAKTGSYAIGGKSDYTGGNSVESRKAQVERAEAAGIPLSMPDQGEAKQGLRTKMRGDYIRSGAAKAARDKVEADEAAKRYEKRAKAKTESDALRDSTYNSAEAGIDLRTQRRRSAARVKGGDNIHGKSWMEHMEAGNLDASGNIKKDVQVGSTVEISLKSNVDTDAKAQTDKLASKADEYLKTSAETLKEMLSLMKKAGPGGQLTIG